MAFTLFPVSITLKMLKYNWMTFSLQVSFTLILLFKKIIMSEKGKDGFLTAEQGNWLEIYPFIRHFQQRKEHYYFKC